MASISSFGEPSDSLHGSKIQDLVPFVARRNIQNVPESPKQLKIGLFFFTLSSEVNSASPSKFVAIVKFQNVTKKSGTLSIVENIEIPRSLKSFI